MLVYLTCPVILTNPPTRKWVHPTLCERNSRNNLSVSLFVCLSCTLAGGCYYFGQGMSVCLTCQQSVQKLCTQIWVCTVLLLVSASESASLVLSSTVLVCQQVFPPLGCVSLPNLLCCSSQLLNQKWVQVLCTPVCVCTV